MKIYVIDFEFSLRTKRVLSWVGVPALALGVAAAAFGAVPHSLTAGNPIRAQELMDNFNDLDTRVAAATERSHSGARISVKGIWCGESTATTTGRIEDLAAGVHGYEAARNICRSACGNSPTAHMCSAEEMVRSAQIGAVVGTNYYWVSAGVPIPAPGQPTPTRPTGDCSGWRSSSSTEFGLVWFGAGQDACAAGVPGPCPNFTNCGDSTVHIACCD